jgi:hypothetical protein
MEQCTLALTPAEYSTMENAVPNLVTLYRTNGFITEKDFDEPLRISSCHGLTALPALPALAELWIDDCSELKTPDLFAPNDMRTDLLCLVVISRCRQLKTVIINRTVSRLQVIACSQLSELKVNEEIKYLTAEARYPALTISGSGRILQKRGYQDEKKEQKYFASQYQDK